MAILQYAADAELETVIFNKAWTPIFSSLSDEDAGRLIKAVCAALDGEDAGADLEGAALTKAYKTITARMDFTAKKYLQRIRQA